jgi:hypothetical protein
MLALTQEAPAANPEPEKRRWLVVVPVFTHVLPAAFYNFLCIFLRAGADVKGHSFVLMNAERQILHMIMNKAVEIVVSQDYAGLIAFDDDCLPPPYVLDRLIAHTEKGRDFIAGMGYMRNYPHTTTVGKHYPEGLTYQHDVNAYSAFYWLDALPTKERGVMEADFCGLPVAIWTKAALQRCERPVFGTVGKDGGEMTHDVFMCRRLKAAGIPVLVDTSIECGHIAPAPIVNSLTRTGAREAVRIMDAAVKQAVEIEAAPI